MKYTLVILTAILSQLVFGQDEFPDFLQGTWKMEGREIYEHWDKLTDKSLLGFSYKLNNGQMKVSEYLEIKQHDKLTIYTATVVNQNHGNAVDFKLTKTNNSFTFENPNHDFSKKIVYQKLSDTQIFVQVSDGNNNGFSYKMYKQNIEDTTTPNPNFDRALAEKLGGDEYGMKSYFFVILKKGTNTTADKELIGQSFRGHLDNINQLVEEKKLIVAGPLEKNENNYRGIFILNNITLEEEANALLQSDPAIKNGLLDYEIFSWYGSAALPEYLPTSDKIWKSKP